MEKWAYYYKDAAFLGVSYINIATINAEEVKKQLTKEGLQVDENLIVWLVRDYC